MSAQKQSMHAAMHILIVSGNESRVSVLQEALRIAGHDRLSVVADVQNLMRRIVELDPAAIVIDLERPDRVLLEQLFSVSRCVRRPIAMYVDQSTPEMIEAAVQAGIGAYVVDGFAVSRIKATLDLAICRFNAFEKLRTDLERTQTELDERKLIERAKGILMRERGLTEQAAYGLMRKAAMNENRRLSEVAQSILTAASLLK